MKNSRPSLMFPAVCMIMAWAMILLGLSVGGVFAPTTEEMTTSGAALSLGFLGVALILVSVGVLGGINWWRYTNNYRVREESLALVAGELAIREARNQFINRMALLSDTQFAGLTQYQAEVEVIPGDGDHGPLVRLVVPGGTVSWLMVEEYVAACTHEELAPVRRWGDGPKREEIRLLVSYFVMNGYAYTAEGNQPAKWVSANAFTEALKSIGYWRIQSKEGE